MELAGGGFKVYLKQKWMTLRVNVYSYIHPTISGDVSFLSGLAFHLSQEMLSKLDEDINMHKETL